MREILFRGKEKSNGEWVDGGVVQGILHELWQNAERAYITVFPQYLSTLKLVEVDPSTLGQYTGLTDENGKKIFEGDIVRYMERQFDGEDVPIVGVVEYLEGGFVVSRHSLNRWLWNGADGNIRLREIEVIGNIHDNPELVKGGNDG